MLETEKKEIIQMKKGPTGPKHKGAYPAYMGKLRDAVSIVSSVFGASGGASAGKVLDDKTAEPKAKTTKEKAPSKKPLSTK